MSTGYWSLIVVVGFNFSCTQISGASGSLIRKVPHPPFAAMKTSQGYLASVSRWCERSRPTETCLYVRHMRSNHMSYQALYGVRLHSAGSVDSCRYLAVPLTCLCSLGEGETRWKGYLLNSYSIGFPLFKNRCRAIHKSVDIVCSAQWKKIEAQF